MIEGLTRFVGDLLPVPTRLRSVVSWYLLSLMVEARLHSLTFAESLSGMHRSQFSRLLSDHPEVALTCLTFISQYTAQRLARSREVLVPGTRWTVAIIVDSTLHHRSSRHIQNSKKFNHGQGYVIGHQWTNIVIVVNGETIALPPIPFYTKNECKRRGIPYKTEHEKVAIYLKSLDLNLWIGPHTSEEIVVLTDSGYDAKDIQNTIHGRTWDHVSALKSSRNAQTQFQHESDQKTWARIDQLFRNARKQAPWKTTRVRVDTQGRRKKFRTRRIEGYLKDLTSKGVLICSQIPGKKGRKFLYCSNSKINSEAILSGYRLRWNVELFHRAVKSNFGLQHAGVEAFDSLHSHVHWVYCAYLLSKYPDFGERTKGVETRQRDLLRQVTEKPFRQLKQALTQLGTKVQLVQRCRNILEEVGMGT